MKRAPPRKTKPVEEELSSEEETHSQPVDTHSTTSLSARSLHPSEATRKNGVVRTRSDNGETRATGESITESRSAAKSQKGPGVRFETNERSKADAESHKDDDSREDSGMRSKSRAKETDLSERHTRPPTKDARPLTKTADTKSLTRNTSKTTSEEGTARNTTKNTAPSAKANARVDTKANARIDTKANARVDTKANAKVDTKANTKVDTKAKNTAKDVVNMKGTDKTSTKSKDTKEDTKEDLQEDAKSFEEELTEEEKEIRRKEKLREIEEHEYRRRIDVFDREVRSLIFELKEVYKCAEMRTTPTKAQAQAKEELENFSGIYVKSPAESYLDTFYERFRGYRDRIMGSADDEDHFDDWISEEKPKFWIISLKTKDGQRREFTTHCINFYVFYLLARDNSAYYEERLENESEEVRKKCKDLYRDWKALLHLLRIFLQLTENKGDREGSAKMLERIRALEKHFGFDPTTLRKRIEGDSEEGGIMGMIQGMLGGAMPEGQDKGLADVAGALKGVLGDDAIKDLMKDVVGGFKSKGGNPEEVMGNALDKFKKNGMSKIIKVLAPGTEDTETDDKGKEKTPEDELDEVLAESEEDAPAGYSQEDESQGEDAPDEVQDDTST